jgi:hypothetical protein
MSFQRTEEGGRILFFSFGRLPTQWSKSVDCLLASVLPPSLNLVKSNFMLNVSVFPTALLSRSEELTAKLSYSISIDNTLVC